MLTDSPKDSGLSKTKQKKNDYILCLYIAGKSTRSMLAITNLKKICKDYLKDGYKLEIIDLFQFPNLAKENQIFAVPALIKKSPLPFKQILGDLSNTEQVLFGLNLN